MDSNKMEAFNAVVSGAAYWAAIAFVGFVVVFPMVRGQIDAATANNMAFTALGFMGGVIAAGGSWFMRGRTAAPTPGGSSGTGNGAPSVVVQGGDPQNVRVDAGAGGVDVNPAPDPRAPRPPV